MVGTYRGRAGTYRSVQAAVNAARPGDWILIAPGDYHEHGSSDPHHPAGVYVTTPGIHIRGLDRNHTVVDGTTYRRPAPCTGDAAAPGPRAQGRRRSPSGATASGCPRPTASASRT